MTFTDVQLDGLRELANIGSAQAAAALGQMLGGPVDISVPTAAAMPLDEAVAYAGDADDMRYGVLVPIVGEFDANVLLLIPADDAEALTGTFGVHPSDEYGRSALQEIGNILGTSYINVLAQMCGMDMEPAPPQVVADMLGAILASVLLSTGEIEDVLILDSKLDVEDRPCKLSFLLLPAKGGVEELLGRIGLA